MGGFITIGVAAVFYCLVFIIALVSHFFAVIMRRIVESKKRRVVYQPYDGEPEAVVTLVHGTWARNATWTEAESSLCQMLRTTFEGRVRIERFPWSGANAAGERWRAAERFYYQMDSLMGKWPTAKH
jgi:hypothetical protein